MDELWAALDNNAAGWRKVFKVRKLRPRESGIHITWACNLVQRLALLEALIKNGNERVIEDARDHLHKIRSLTDFNFYEGNTDRGNGGPPVSLT